MTRNWLKVVIGLLISGVIGYFIGQAVQSERKEKPEVFNTTKGDTIKSVGTINFSNDTSANPRYIPSNGESVNQKEMEIVEKAFKQLEKEGRTQDIGRLFELVEQYKKE